MQFHFYTVVNNDQVSLVNAGRSVSATTALADSRFSLLVFAALRVLTVCYPQNRLPLRWRTVSLGTVVRASHVADTMPESSESLLCSMLSSRRQGRLGVIAFADLQSVV